MFRRVPYFSINPPKPYSNQHDLGFFGLCNVEAWIQYFIILSLSFPVRYKYSSIYRETPFDKEGTHVRDEVRVQCFGFRTRELRLLRCCP